MSIFKCSLVTVHDSWSQPVPVLQQIAAEALSFQDDEGSQAIYSQICHEPGFAPEKPETDMGMGQVAVKLAN